MLNFVLSFVLTFFYLLCGLLELIVVTPLIAITRVFDWTGRTPLFFSRWYLAILSYAIGLKLTVTGLENIDRKQVYLIISNHKSSVDILVLSRVLPLYFRFFATRYLFYIPLFGWLMCLAGHIPVNRRNRTSAYKSVRKATRMLSRGKSSLLIFPEGTRSAVPRIRPFKRGFLHIASEAKRPILPVVLDGTSDIKRKGELLFHSGHVFISILPPVPSENLKRKAWEDMRQSLENQTRTEYQRLRNSYAGKVASSADFYE